MNVRRRVVTACALACVLSGAATLALSWRMARVSAAESTRMRTYVAPARTVPAGQTLQNADVHLMPWPAASPVQGGFERVADAVGRTTLYPLAQGQPLLESDLSPRGSGPGLAGRIPDGMRALAIRSDEVVGVGGFLSPGLHVDMLVTLQAAGSAQTGIVLQDVEVIAVGQQSEPDPQGKPATATVVTLLLTPEQAQRALLSSSQGSVHFVLRNSGDRANTDNAAVTLADLGAAMPRPALVPVMPAAGPEGALLQPAPAAVLRPAAAALRQAARASSGAAMPEMILGGHAGVAANGGAGGTR